MKKIVLAGAPYVKNLGDPVLFESTEYLVDSTIKDEFITIERLDLFQGNTNTLRSFIIRGFNKLINTVYKKERRNTKFFYKAQKYLIEAATKDYYKNKIRDSDIIIFVGGGMIKYKYETFDFRISILTEMANTLNIPVIFNAVGVEGYSEKNIRCQQVKKVLNQDNVKLITTRDDIDLLNEKYITNFNITTGQVADSAFWSDMVYDISKNENSDIIGLGVVRGKIFNDNDIPITENELLELWCEIIKELEFRELKWKLFTNGLDADNEFMDLLLKKIGREDETDVLTIIPKTSKELVETIAGFNKVIACRMHASIIAYSLEIPTIGLIWNDKIKMFGEIIGYPDRFIQYKVFEAEHIVNKLLQIEITSKDREFKNTFRKTTFNSLKKCIDEILN